MDWEKMNMFTDSCLQPLLSAQKSMSQEKQNEIMQDVYAIIDELTEAKRREGDKEL